MPSEDIDPYPPVPLSYAAPRSAASVPSPRLVAWIGGISICVGALSILSNGWLFARLYQNMMWAKGAKGSYLVFIAPVPEYAAAALVFFVLAGFVLGGCLSVIGIGTLRHPVASRKLHRIYAWLKVALSVLELMMGIWLLVGLTMHLLPDDLSVLFAAIEPIEWSILGFVYPICLLIALRRHRPGQPV